MRWALACVSVVALWACDGDRSPVPGPADGGSRADAAPLEDAALPADGGSADAAPAGDAAPTDAEPLVDSGVRIDERGFPIRVPQRRTVPCNDRGSGGCQGESTESEDVDFVCTLRHGSRDQLIYVQSRPTRLDASLGIFPLPIYQRDGAWVSDGTQVVSSGHGGFYDYGGGHHNDALTLELGDVTYRYYHSSFGFGFRRCQEMDCVQSFAPGASTPTDDGCTRDRTLPVVCVRVAADGTVPALTDTFMRCAGDGS